MDTRLTIRSKYKLIKRFSSLFRIKTGSIFKNDIDECYKVAKWFSFFYLAYLFFLSSDIGIVFVLLLSFYLDGLFGIWWLDILVAIAVFIVVEIAVIAIIPLEKVPCWEKNLEEKKEKGI